MLVDRFGNAFQQLPKEGIEVDTGLKWYDGRPIYRNFKIINLEENTSASVEIGGSAFDYFFIDSSTSCLLCVHPNSPGFYYFYPVNYGSNDGTRIICFLQNNSLRVGISENFKGYNNIFYINYMYVKRN